MHPLGYKIIKPKIDTNVYKYIKLENQLEMLIIYDKDTDISAAAMTVEVGYYSDPNDTQGLAHFLEHMLFMGTKKYPEENYFQKFINEAGGLTNAHTTNESTTYYYQVYNEHFMESIDSFAQFFIEPLLSPNSVEREINAVNSEHQKNLTFDDARISSVIQSLVENKHPFYNFGTGNKDTLTKDNIRDILIKFYDQYYSANIMKLVILTNQEIDNIEKDMIKLFSTIKNKNVSIKKINYLPFDNQNNNTLCQYLIKIIPTQDIHRLIIGWYLPNMDKEYHIKPIEFIANLFGHESEGSIYYYLKKNGLCINVGCNIFEHDSSFNFLGIDIILTDQGLKQIPNIINSIYAYLDMLNIDKMEWFYDEMRTMNNIKFDFFEQPEKIDYVAELSMNMCKYKLEDVINGDYKMELYHKKIITECLRCMTKQNSIVIISSKEYDGKTSQIEKWYGTQFSSIKNPQSYGEEFNTNKMDYNLHLPEKNIFIPKDLKIIKSKKQKTPIKIKENIWYMQDDFEIPRVFCSLIINLNNFYEKVENVVLLNLYMAILDYKLESTIYYAKLCSTTYNVSIESNQLIITFNGYRDTINKLSQLFVKTLLNMDISKEEFDIVKYNINVNLVNFIYKPAYIIIKDYFMEKIYSINHTNNELIRTLQTIKYEDVNIPRQLFVNKCSIKIFIYGNVDKKNTMILCKQFDKIICHNQEEDNKQQIIYLENGERHLYVRKSLNKSDDNYAIYLFFEIGHITKGRDNWDLKILYTNLIDIHVREQFFNDLRTQEQTGYVVRSMLQYFNDNNGNLMGLSFLIQSPHINPMILRKKIKKFVEKMYDQLRKIDDKQFIMYKTIVKNNLIQNFMSQSEEFNFMKNEITNKEYRFKYKEELLKAMDKLTKQNLIQFYDDYFINSNLRKIRTIELYKKN